MVDLSWYMEYPLEIPNGLWKSIKRVFRSKEEKAVRSRLEDLVAEWAEEHTWLTKEEARDELWPFTKEYLKKEIVREALQVVKAGHEFSLEVALTPEDGFRYFGTVPNPEYYSEALRPEIEKRRAAYEDWELMHQHGGTESPPKFNFDGLPDSYVNAYVRVSTVESSP